MGQETKQRPVHQAVMPFAGGVLRGAIWKHEDDQGHPWFSVSFSRARKDHVSGQWTYSNFFQRHELPALARLVEVAHRIIVAGNLTGGADHE